jgi:hypothetical protein
MHLDIIIYTRAVTQEFGQDFPKFVTNNYGIRGMVVDPYDPVQHMNALKHLVYVWSGHGNHSM